MVLHEDLLHLMDLLDLDEELVDSRLKMIMLRKNWTNRHLISAIQLLNYKQLINIQDKTECDNNAEFDFAIKLLTYMHDGNIEYVCRVMNIAMNLNNDTIVNKAEHILQQIFPYINSQSENERKTENIQSLDKNLLHLKICDTVLDVIIKNGKAVTLSFLDIPLENIIMNPDKQTFVHFLTLTVPRLFEAGLNYNILDKIWNFIKEFKCEYFIVALKVLTCLSEFYLPVRGTGQNIYESVVVYECEFYKFILFGLESKEVSHRKISVYLAKRAIDYLMNVKKDFQVYDEDKHVMTWEFQNKIELKIMWDNYFILIDSLEEKQSNIVLPSLKLFECLGKIKKCWLDCTFTMGLQHENSQVRFKCIEYKLKTSMDNEFEAQVLLEALNDINIYDQASDHLRLKEEISKKIHDLNFFVHIFKAFPRVKWSSVPLCYMTNILATLSLDELFVIIDSSCFCEIIRDMLKIPCNNILLRTEILGNITEFIGNCCKKLNWKQCTNILTTINFKNVSLDNTELLISKMQIKPLENEEKATFFKIVTDSHTKINYCLGYLYNRNKDVGFFIEVINNKLANVHDIVQRQYSNKSICWNDIIFLICLLKQTNNKEHVLHKIINYSITKEYKIILKYILCVLSTEIIPPLEEANMLFSVLDYDTKIDNDCKELFVQIHRLTTTLLKDGNVEIAKKVYCANAIKNLLKNISFDCSLIKCSTILDITSISKSSKVSTNENNGKLRNVLNGDLCEIVFYLLKNDTSKIDKNINKIVLFAEYMIGCGGCGCLKWILKIMNIILPFVLHEDNVNIDITMFINKSWIEIEELKTNNQYSPCIKEFVNLITHNELLKRSIYNNIVVLYCNKIIECGALKSTPLYYLVQELNSKDILHYAQVLYVVRDILLFSPVPRKDQRIAENFIIKLLSKPKYKDRLKGTDLHFNFQIQYTSISVLCKMKTHLEIRTLITKRIDEKFKNKDRYHENSQHHRILLTGLQHLLITKLLMPETDEIDEIANWCMKLLGNLPHQPSVRICLEWYIALNCYSKKLNIDKDIITHLISNNVPLSSQFVILYWILRHKMLNNTYTLEEFEFVMDTLLSHTMGQMFSTRLHAQYLAKNIYANGKNKKKYEYIIDVIEKTFVESQNEKMYLKLQSDYFMNYFNIIKDLTPCFVYYFLPRYCDVNNNEFVHIDYMRDILTEINTSVDKNVSCNSIKSEWNLCHKSDDDIFSMKLDTKAEMNRIIDTNKLIGTIQKKYVPWRNMTDIDVYEIGKKKENKGDLIVVASLIDKLPNLGGMARTSEVFGVKTYVINSLRHLQDKQFQGLSVSAERWIDIEEVRPGAPLKSYLMKKKAEGYTLVAAEQTSTSCQLQKFKFPSKTLLMLGHEKEGVPCDLLPIMDYCVEIPQKGVVRSLNVHVTAAIFIWEYSRQNIL